MKKIPSLLVCLFILLSLSSMALSETLADALTEKGFSPEDAAWIAAIVAEAGELSEAEALRLAEALEESGQAQGTVTGVRYTHPQGFSFDMPEGWSEKEEPGVSVLIAGPAYEGGFVPTISVQAVTLNAGADPFADVTQDALDTLYGEMLPNYLTIALDSFDFQGGKAHEFAFTYGPGEDTMLMQYQLFFSRNDTMYIITMTTLAEESAHDSALSVYDMLLESFQVEGQEGVGFNG